MEPTTENFIDTYQEKLDSTPEEVRAFLWSDAYKGIIAGIIKTCSLSEEQGAVVSDILFDLTIGAIDQTGAQNKMTAAHISPEQQGVIVTIGYEYVINPSITEAQESIETDIPDTSTAQSTTTANAPSPADVLATLGARLSQPTISPRGTPLAATQLSKRDYSLDTTLNAESQKMVHEEPKGIAAIDPYREIPEK